MSKPIALFKVKGKKKLHDTVVCGSVRTGTLAAHVLFCWAMQRTLSLIIKSQHNFEKMRKAAYNTDVCDNHLKGYLCHKKANIFIFGVIVIFGSS